MGWDSRSDLRLKRSGLELFNQHNITSAVFFIKEGRGNQWPHGSCARLANERSGFEPWGPGTLWCVIVQDTLSIQVFKCVSNLMLGVTLWWTSIPSRVDRNTQQTFFIRSREAGTYRDYIYIYIYIYWVDKIRYHINCINWREVWALQLDFSLEKPTLLILDVIVLFCFLYSSGRPNSPANPSSFIFYHKLLFFTSNKFLKSG